ncbi:MAG: 50S ribosomal protein L10 [Syntrophaceae bacterium CG2_30_49_12]|nr:MAG: 50S ribosomal protein L10 [Syntrophaceae bacterium CG2_30_49_12]PJA50328.1 MAG: 50S ribosomal protein L10 [Syntrophobacterales bacterium CG_4_9_14_3_um_filter_49_8]
MDRSTKERVVVELQEKIKDLRLAILANYRNLTVEKMTALRNALRKTNTNLMVVKNTLLRIASKDTNFHELEEYFKGPLTIALSHDDVVEPTKLLVDFAKKNAELEIKAGMLTGKILSKEQIIVLAELPGREVLLGKLLSVLVGVHRVLVSVLSGVPRSLVCVLDAYRAKKESGN